MHSVGDAKRKWEQSEHKQNTIRVQLLCKSNIKVKCEEYLNGTLIEDLENGDFIYEFHVPEKEQFWYGTVLAFGSNVKVIKPPDLIEKICLNCNEILKQYKDV